jgi:hypothetical protein
MVIFHFLIHLRRRPRNGHLRGIHQIWVVLPQAPRRVQSPSVLLIAQPAETGTDIIGRSAVRKRNPSQSSRGVDAILVTPFVSPRIIKDSEADDITGPLLERSLRRRGLSNSSIHSTFMNRGGDGNESNIPRSQPPRVSSFQHLPLEPYI